MGRTPEMFFIGKGSLRTFSASSAIESATTATEKSRTLPSNDSGAGSMAGSAGRSASISCTQAPPRASFIAKLSRKSAASLLSVPIFSFNSSENLSVCSMFSVIACNATTQVRRRRALHLHGV